MYSNIILVRGTQFAGDSSLRLFATWARLPLTTCLSRTSLTMLLQKLGRVSLDIVRQSRDPRAVRAALRILAQCVSVPLTAATRVIVSEALELMCLVMPAISTAAEAGGIASGMTLDWLCELQNADSVLREDRLDEMEALGVLLFAALLPHVGADSSVVPRVLGLLRQAAQSARRRNGAAVMLALAQVLRNAGSLAMLPPAQQADLIALSGAVLEWSAVAAPFVHTFALGALRDFATRTAQADLVPKMVPLETRPAFSALARKLLPERPTAEVNADYGDWLRDRADRALAALAKWPALEVIVRESLTSATGDSGMEFGERAPKRLKSDDTATIALALSQFEEMVTMIERTPSMAVDDVCISKMGDLYRRLGTLLQIL
jgi:hypothetical protein